MPAKLAPCYQCGGDSTKCDCGEKLKTKREQEMIENGICPECFESRELDDDEKRTKECMFLKIDEVIDKIFGEFK